MTVLVTVETVVLAVLCVLVAGLLRAYAEVLRRLHALDGGAGPAASAAAPFQVAAGVTAPVVDVERREEWTAGHDLAGTTLEGDLATARVVGVGHDTVLAFLSSGCEGCQGFWADLAEPGFAPAPGARLLVVTKDAEDESVAALSRLAAPGVDVLLSTQAWEDYAVPGSPFVVVVDGATGRVKGHGSGSSFHQVSGLLARATGDLAAARGGSRVRKPRADVEREEDVDSILLGAGITPGHPSLYGEER